MSSSRFLSIARHLMNVPAAPFHEHAVRDVVSGICREHGLAHKTDRFGNLLVTHKRGGKRRPMVMVAHLDHPGFEIVGRIDSKRFRARFLGGVPERYFRKGTRLRLMPGAVAARLGRALGGEKEYEIVTDRRAAGDPEYGVWELQDFALRSGRILGRACDDLVGVAAMLTTLVALKESRRAGWAIGAITRAEEIGFGGALSLAGSRAIPRNSLVVSLETSRELPGVEMSKGVIVRVGDRSSVFDSDATRFFHENALALEKRLPKFKMQRALMGGGSCEGTVFHSSGFQTAALCVALGNYHNCGPRNRVAEEFVSRRDAETMVDLLVESAHAMNRFREIAGRLSVRLEKIRGATRERLLTRS